MSFLLWQLLLLSATAIASVSASFSSSAKEESYSNVMYRMGLEMREQLDANLALTAKNETSLTKKKWINFPNILTMVGMSKGAGNKNPQEDLDQLAAIYSALNYADMAALELLRRDCVEAILDPSTDRTLCEEYPKLLLKTLEGRIGTISSYILFSDVVKAPSGWIDHAREILQMMQADPEGNTRAYSLHSKLLQIKKDELENRGRDDPAPQSPHSPFRKLTNRPEIMYTPGMSVNVPVSFVPEPVISTEPPAIAHNTPQTGVQEYPASSGMTIVNGQVANGPVTNYSGGNASPCAPSAPCANNGNVLAIPVVPIANLGTSPQPASIGNITLPQATIPTPPATLNNNLNPSATSNASAIQQVTQSPNALQQVAQAEVNQPVNQQVIQSGQPTNEQPVPITGDSAGTLKPKSSFFGRMFSSKPKPETTTAATTIGEPAQTPAATSTSKGYWSGLFGGRSAKKE